MRSGELAAVGGNVKRERAAPGSIATNSGGAGRRYGLLRRLDVATAQALERPELRSRFEPLGNDHVHAALGTRRSDNERHLNGLGLNQSRIGIYTVVGGNSLLRTITGRAPRYTP